ncbi:hypothetical protein E2C01_015268 [Portunus trituberculatus]|uniref:Uncharacterized protein n=1 Tax=Portunus trituberculatus TaxID=210409 RepID=A0A5B7DLC5_PORTR|nr:hypothetical protein [Portunus trituberculatus]
MANNSTLTVTAPSPPVTTPPHHTTPLLSPPHITTTTTAFVTHPQTLKLRLPHHSPPSHNLPARHIHNLHPPYHLSPALRHPAPDIDSCWGVGGRRWGRIARGNQTTTQPRQRLGMETRRLGDLGWQDDEVAVLVVAVVVVMGMWMGIN